MLETEREPDEKTIQNLRDAGCELKTIALFLQFHDAGKIKDQLYLLSDHRKKLLNGIHKEQAKLDCLDYLIYQLRKAKQ